MRICLLIILFLFYSNFVNSQDTISLNYELAIKIALNKSNNLKSNFEKKLALQHYYNYTNAQFKPRLDFDIYTPSWNESVTQVQQADGLPVYNSFGSIRFEGLLSFTIVLPTGGNLSLTSNFYGENISNTLVEQNYERLSTNQAFAQFALNFNQPIFTTNKLKEDMQEAKILYKKSSNYFSRIQLDIIHEVTKNFYLLLKAKKEVDIAKSKLDNTISALNISKLMSNSGRIPKLELLNSELSKIQANLIYSECKNKFKNEKDNFKKIIGLDFNKTIKIESKFDYDTFNVNLEKAIKDALNNRYELSELNLDLDIQKIRINQAERISEFRGDISAYFNINGFSSIAHGSLKELSDAVYSNFRERPPNRGIILNFSYPIYDWGRGSERVQQEKAYLNDIRYRKEQTKNSIICEIRELVRTFYELRNRITLYEKNSHIAKQTYEITKLRFKHGNINSQDLSIAQERLSDAELKHLEAYISYQLVISELKYKTLWDFQYNRKYHLLDY